MTVWHLARRFVGSLSPRPPAAESVAEVESELSPELMMLWRRMSAPDQRHSIEVTERVRAEAPDAPPWVVVASLLHDVGKVESGLGTLGRTAATVVRPLRPRLPMPQAFVTYWDHPQRGAALIADAGGDDRAAAWAAEHHRSPSHWSVPAQWGEVLKRCDDD